MRNEELELLKAVLPDGYQIVEPHGNWTDHRLLDEEGEEVTILFDSRTAKHVIQQLFNQHGKQQYDYGQTMGAAEVRGPILKALGLDQRFSHNEQLLGEQMDKLYERVSAVERKVK